MSNRGRHALLSSCAFLAALAVGCGSSAVDGADGGPTGPTVDEFASTGCSTAVVLGLSLEIADEMGCIDEGALAVFEPSPRVEFASAAVLPYLSVAAIADLEAASNEDVAAPLRINSAFRTVAQQYLLSEWFSRGLCGITAAATPGRSNHESGRALDIGNYTEWRAALGRHNWDQTVPGDEVHFDHALSTDERGLDVLAFQVLWNRANPGDLIEEDGQFGPTTASRLSQSPAGGFGQGASCSRSLSAKRAALYGVLPSVLDRNRSHSEGCEH